MAGYHGTNHSPLALWQFNGNLNDSSGVYPPRNLSVTSGVARYVDVLPGLLGLWFDGSTRLDVSASALTAITGDVTIEYLVIFDRSLADQQSPVHPAIAEDPANTGKNYTWYLSFQQHALRFRWFHEHGHGVDVEYYIEDGLAVGVPYHIAAVRESNVVRFYLNGRRIGDASATLIASEDGSTAPMLVGGEIGEDAFKGVVASIKIIGSALTDEEVEDEFNATLGGIGATGHSDEHSPVALWQFDGDLNDSIGDNHLSIAAGTERYTELAPGLRGLHLDGNTVLSCAYDAALHITGNLTIECGFVPGVSDEAQDLIRFGGGSGQASNTAYALRIVGQQHSLSYLAEYGSSVPKTTSTHSTNDGLVVGTLYHLAVRRSSQQISFFINGRLVGSTSGTLTAPDGGGSGLMYLGFSGSEIKGAITSVKIVAAALTDEQIEEEAATFFGA